MPHLVIEYSANLDAAIDIMALLRVLHTAAIETGAFPQDAIRTRAERRDAYIVGNGDQRNAFVAITGRIASGRPESLRNSLGQAMFEAVKAHLSSVQERIPLSLTFELQEIDSKSSFRHNTVNSFGGPTAWTAAALRTSQ